RVNTSRRAPGTEFPGLHGQRKGPGTARPGIDAGRECKVDAAADPLGVTPGAGDTVTDLERRLGDHHGVTRAVGDVGDLRRRVETERAANVAICSLKTIPEDAA